MIFWEMSVPDKVSFFSRFFVKLVEIFAAGIATAVGGYLIAHLGGLWSPTAPAPAAVQVAPNANAVSKSMPAQSTTPASVDANEQHAVPQQAAEAPAAQPARKAANTTKPAVSPKHAKADKADTTAAESKSSDEESVEARVRAALANIDANRPAPAVVPPRQADVSPGPAAVGTLPQPADRQPGTATAAVSPRAADPQPQAVQPQAPVQPAPLTSVEIESRPVATIETMPAAQPAPPAEEEKGIFATLKKIPSLLRPEPPGEAPRPPMPVGE
ncbi:MAG: hypothetical protein ABR992_19795 [Solirubrobacteraceae bacterium]